MREPDDLTGLVDKFGDTWVRVDDCPGRNGPWHPLTDGPGRELWARGGVGNTFQWSWMDDYGPFTPADPDRTARAIDYVREEYAR